VVPNSDVQKSKESQKSYLKMNKEVRCLKI